jgi:hypothetical protein
MASLDPLTFTLAIPPEVPVTQLISDPSNPYPGHHVSMVILTIGKCSFHASHKQEIPDYLFSKRDYSYIKYLRQPVAKTGKVSREKF